MLDAWIVWLAFGIFATLLEILLPHFGVIFVGLAAVGGSIAAYLGYGLTVQIVGFVVVLGLSLAFLRPRFVSRLGAAPGVPGRTEALVGRAGVVTQDIDPVLGTGRVNVGGEDWAARSHGPLGTGTRIRVVGADGIILEVTAA